MNTWKLMMTTLLLAFGCLAFAQDDLKSAYGWRPVGSQEDYDSYVERFYLTKPYTNQDYERDLLFLYQKNQQIKKVSEYCPVKMKKDEDIRNAYRLWSVENSEYVQLINSLWKKLINSGDGSKKQLLQAQVDNGVERYIDLLKDDRNHNYSCHEEYMFIAYGKDKPRRSEEEKFSYQYRNIDFFLNPDKKQDAFKKLKEQLNVSLKEKKSCEQAGGTWRPIGMLQSMACITKYPDAGKSCTDNSQCKGGCLDVTPHDHVGDRIGKCKTDDDHFGCTSYLTKGKRDGPVLCID